MASFVTNYLMEHPEQIEKSQRDVVRIAKELVKKSSSTSAYSYLVNSNNSNRECMTYGDLADFSKECYTLWCDYLSLLAKKHNDEKVRQGITAFINTAKFKPENVSDKQALVYMFYDNKMKDLAKTTGFLVPYFQEVATLEDEEINLLSLKDAAPLTFVHFRPFGNNKTKRRIYLSVDVKNAPKIAIALAERAMKDGERVYTKFNTSGSRRDVMLAHVADEKIPVVLKYLDEIQAEHPEYFIPKEKISIAAPLREYAGLTDEPEYNHSSFNNELGHALDEFQKEYRAQFARYLANDRAIMRELQPLVENTYKKALVLRVDNEIKRSQNSTDKYVKFNESFYRGIASEIVAASKDKNHKLNHEITDAADRFIQGLENGKISGNFSITRFFTESPYLNMVDENIDAYGGVRRVFEKNGGLNQRVECNPKLLEIIIDKYGLQEKIDREVTLKAIAPYLEERHLSPYCPFLNTESVAEVRAELVAERENAMTKNSVQTESTANTSFSN